MPASPAKLPFRKGIAPTQSVLVDGAAELVSPPAVCMKMMQMVRAPNTSAADFAKLISQDPNLALRVLRIVNSAYYGMPSQVDSLSRAVVILGTRDLANIVLAVSAVRSFSQVGGGLVSADQFWQHSIYVSLAARRLARHFDVAEPERLFIAGLLHDTGSAVLYGAHPKFADWMRAAAGTNEDAVVSHEQEHLNFTHASLAAQLLESWELPVALRNAIASHHPDPGPADSIDESLLLRIADQLSSLSPLGAITGEQSEPDQVLDNVLSQASALIDADTLTALADDVNSEFAETAKALRN